MLEDYKVNIKIKLAALWTAVMFLFVYVDIFAFYKPGTITDILAGKVWEFDISQMWALTALILMAVPILMIYMSLVLKAKINRWLNIIVGILYVLVAMVNPIGESWAFLYLGFFIELVLLILIVWNAWKWPTSQKRLPNS